MIPGSAARLPSADKGSAGRLIPDHKTAVTLFQRSIMRFIFCFMVKRVDSAGERVNERDVKQDSRAEASHNSESDNETDSDFVKKKSIF